MKIKELILETPNLQKQKIFYTKVLGFLLVKDGDDEVSVEIGTSLLTFRTVRESTPYHFAFNISHNMIKESLAWLQPRVEVLTFKGEVIQIFKDWHASAIYFYDPDGNIVEFIARRHISIQAVSTSFDRSHFQCISEIGVPTDVIQPIYEVLNQQLGVLIFDGTFDRFCAIGTDEGLFICIDSNQKKWFPVDDIAYPSNFKLKCSIDDEEYQVTYQNGSLEVDQLYL